MNTDINKLNLAVVQEIEDSNEEDESRFFSKGAANSKLNHIQISEQREPLTQ